MNPASGNIGTAVGAEIDHGRLAHQHQVRAYDLLRMFGREGRPTPLGAAFAEYGRIAKTDASLSDGARTAGSFDC